ncbi:MAG TPA: hypothetical protein VFW33_08840 [Gemmataceae bacterium]|nr:hypothetical protein [Gemmataceae bacterium]
MTSETNERYVGGQVRSRANVILTRRDDLRVVETKDQTGLDMHVYVDREDKPMRLVFGVLLRGVPSPTTADEANKVLVPTMGFFQGLRKFTYPVCLFFFTVREEQAFFSWLAEPVVNGEGPKLVHHTKANCVELTDALLADVVGRVVAWYDAVESVLIA